METKNSQLKTAAETYLKRQARIEHPSGEFDMKSRWYPDNNEKCDCCKNIRKPSAAFPLSLSTHCRSAMHIAILFDVDRRKLLREARAIEANIKMPPAWS